MTEYGIIYAVPSNLRERYSSFVKFGNIHVDETIYEEREDIIHNRIPKNHEILKDLLLSEETPFFYVDKGRETKTVEDAAEHLGIIKKSVSKTVVAFDSENVSNSEEVYLLTVNGNGQIQMHTGLTTRKPDMAIKTLKQADASLIERSTGMEPGWCGPFPLNEKYLENIKYILFKEKYARKRDFVDVALSPTEAMFVSGEEIYRLLKNKYPDKVHLFRDN